MKLLRNWTMASGSLQTGFFVRGTGHFIINERETVKMAHYGEIFWCVDGSGSFLLDGETYILRPGQIFYYPPNTLHNFTAEGRYFNYHWLSIDGKQAGMLFQSLGFTPRVMEAGDCPEDLFAALELCLQNSIKESQLNALNIAFQILTRAIAPKSISRPLLERIKDFIDENYSQSNLDVSAIANYFQIHRVSLTRQFQAYFGIAPGKYLYSVRIQNGIKLLGSTSLTCKVIAEKCGFSSPDYFAKSIRKSLRLPLRELRNRKQRQDENL